MKKPSTFLRHYERSGSEAGPKGLPIQGGSKPPLDCFVGFASSQ